MKKSLLVSIGAFLASIVVLSITCYAWFTKRTDVVGLDAGTKGLTYEYRVGDSQELKFKVTNLAFFDFETDELTYGITSTEIGYFSSMACKVSFTLTNTGKYDFTYTLQNKNVSLDTPYVEFLVFPKDTDVSIYSSYSALEAASIKDTANNLIEVGKSQTVDFYIFGAVPNIPKNNEFLTKQYFLDLTILVTQKK